MGIVLGVSKYQKECLAKIKKKKKRVPVMAWWLMSPTGIHEDEGSSPGLDQWVGELVLL